MSAMHELIRRIRMAFHRRQLDLDLQEEMRLHIELRRQQQMDAGLTPAAAQRAAYRRFGNATRIREKSLMTWGSEGLESLWQDVLYGTRALLRSPALTVVALVSLALGIGANTAIFSLIDAVMLRSIPVKDPGQLVLLGEGKWNGISSGFGITELYSYPFFRQMQKQNEVFSDTACVFSMLNDVHGYVEGRANPEPMKIQLVSGTYFPTLGIQAQMGRVLNDSDDTSEGSHPVVVVSEGFWKRSLASDPRVLDRRLKLGKTTFNIVGVTPPEFFGTKVGESPDMWVPMSMMSAVPPGWIGNEDNFSESQNIFARLKPGVTNAQATANVNVVYQRVLRHFAGDQPTQKQLEKLGKAHVPLTPMANGLSSLRRQFSEPLQILMGVVALVLLIACANIANLLLARSTARARELAIRQALGARRGRIIRQLLTESLILALVGGALGIGFASVANRLLLRMVSGGMETIPLNVGIDLRLLAFTFGVTVLTAILFGTIPAFRATKLQLTETLKDGRGPTGAGARNPLARMLVISQVALSLVLMVGSGLFLRSLVNLTNVDTGFNRNNVLRLQIDSTATGLREDDPRLTPLFQQIEERVSALPNVTAASFAEFTFNSGNWNSGIFVPGMATDENISIQHNIVGNGFFATMQIPLVLGRTFGPQDTATSQHVSVISEHMAKTLFPTGSPIGRHYRIGEDTPENDRVVIGVVKDAKFGSLENDWESTDYLPYTQRAWGFGDFAVRYTGDFAPVSTSVQQAIHSIDRNMPISRVTTLDEQVGRSITTQRLVAQLSTFFGLLAVFLSCIGIYGLMSYVVSRRTNEIGIRMALGAARSNVRWLVLREILMLVAIGIAIGIPVALGGTRLVAHMLFQLKGTDSVSLIAAMLFLLAVAMLAGYIPARRASRVDPMVALRYE